MKHTISTKVNYNGYLTIYGFGLLSLSLLICSFSEGYLISVVWPFFTTLNQCSTPYWPYLNQEITMQKLDMYRLIEYTAKFKAIPLLYVTHFMSLLWGKQKLIFVVHRVGLAAN